MQHFPTRSITLIVLFLAFGLGVSADEAMTGEEIKSVLSGNTAEGQLLKWDISHKTFYHPSGEYRRVDGNSNRESGKWYVNKHDYLCHEGRRERCRIVKKRDDGGYNVYNKREELIFTFDKIVPGNPNDL